MRRLGYFDKGQKCVAEFNAEIRHRWLLLPDRQWRRENVRQQRRLQEAADHIPFFVILCSLVRAGPTTNAQANSAERLIEGRNVCDMNADAHTSGCYHYRMMAASSSCARQVASA